MSINDAPIGSTMPPFGYGRGINVELKRLPHCYAIPQQGSLDAAGWDLYAAIPENEVWILSTNNRRPVVSESQMCGKVPVLHHTNRVLVPTGITLAIPSGYEVQCRPRSGLAAKHGVTIVNTPGTIDADYRGEIFVILLNTDPTTPFIIQRGDRIAQLVFNKIETPIFSEVDELPPTRRGAGAFGSTG